MGRYEDLLAKKQQEEMERKEKEIKIRCLRNNKNGG